MSRRITAPSHWDARCYRACDICAFGQAATTQQDSATPVCVCPDVRGQRAAVPVPEARANHGPCGPEAHFLSFPGLYA